MSKNKREYSMKYPEGEYGEIYNTQPDHKTIGNDDIDDIEDKIIIINPTNKNKK